MRDQEWLDSALHALDLIYFDGALAEDGVTVKWWPFKVSRSGTFLYGDYSAGRIRMSCVLSDAWVPSFVTVGVLFHETLHHVIGLQHDLTFSLAEAQYVHHAKAAVWENLNFFRMVNETKTKTRGWK